MRINGAWIGHAQTTKSAVAELAGLATSISPEGDSAVFAVELTSSERFAVKIPFERFGALETMLRQASALMTQRLSLRPRLAHERVMALVQGAQRPEYFELFRDPLGGDFCFVYSFRNAAPFALRVDPATCLENMGNAMRMIRTTMN